MGKFIAVQHMFFVTSDGFKVKELKATNKEQAEMEAGHWNNQFNSTFHNTATKVIEIFENETINMPERRIKLTWKQRITGKF